MSKTTDTKNAIFQDVRGELDNRDDMIASKVDEIMNKYQDRWDKTKEIEYEKFKKVFSRDCR